MSKPSDTLARLRARSSEAGRFVLPLDRVWADKAQESYDALRRAEQYALDDEDRGRRVAEAQAAVDAITAEAGDSVAVFRFRRLSRAQYDELVSRNPVTAEQRKEDEDKPWGQKRAFNIETFGPDLVQSVLIEPALSLAEAAAMLNGTEDEVLLSKGEAEALIQQAMACAVQQPRGLPRELALP